MTSNLHTLLQQRHRLRRLQCGRIHTLHMLLRPLLRLSVAPARGTALIFVRPLLRTRAPASSNSSAPALAQFPSFADGYLDKRALHQAEAAVDEKWVMQLWVH